MCEGRVRGTSTAAAQQHAHLISENSHADNPTRLQPRQAFIHDLQAFILQIQAANEEVILVGDFNEAIDTPNHEWENWPIDVD